MKTSSLHLLVTLALATISLQATAQNMNNVIPPTGTLPAGITKVQYQGATCVPFGSAGQIQTNVRAVSPVSTLNDYWVIQYAASSSGFGLTPVKADMYPGVGVYYEEEGLFMKNVNTTGSLRQGSTALTWGRASKLTLSAPVTARLEASSSVSVYLGRTTTESELIVKELSSRQVIYQQPAGSSGWYFWPVPILRAGDYEFQVKARDGSVIKADILFAHNNARTTTTLTTGSTFSSSLAAKSFGYSKFKIRLNRGQKLKFTLTQSNTVDFRLIAADGTLISAGGNISRGASPTLDAVPATGDYYLIFKKPWSTSGAAGAITTNGVVQVLP